MSSTTAVRKAQDFLADFGFGGCLLMKMRFEDAELLRKYARENAEDAFRDLVAKHLDLVWATAQRITCDADLARDVAQSVFIDLARKARFISAPLAPWLYKASVLA